MLTDKPYGQSLYKRLLDYFSTSTPWSRQLWRLGTILEIQELMEAWEARQRGALSESSIKYFETALARRVKHDKGIGNEAERGRLIGNIKRQLVPGSHDVHALKSLLRLAEIDYLERWAAAVEQESPPSVEVASRAVGSHLLDLGFSGIFLHKWLTYHAKYDPRQLSVAEIIREAARLTGRPMIVDQVAIPLVAAPPLPAGDDGGCWLSPTSTSEWLDTWFPNAEPLRHAGALLLEFNSRDLQSTLDRASAEVERITARFRVGSRRRIEFFPFAFIVGEKDPLPLGRRPRRVEIHALERTSSIFSLRLPDAVDSALELLEPVDRGTPAAAVAGGWAALECLFIGPGDTMNRVVAATRMARIVASSYVRHEFTSLANAYATSEDTEFAGALRSQSENFEKARLFEQALRGGLSIEFHETRHRLALERMQEVLTKPDVILPRIVGQLEDAFRRLYRQRNLVVHAGDLTSVALDGALRTVAPLLGAGIDRIVHASAMSGTHPIELAARAEVRLDQAALGRTALVEVLG